MIKYILANTRVGITPEDFFADRSEALTPIMGVHYIPGKMDKLKSRFSDILDRNAKQQKLLYYMGDPDFSHTSPNWKNLLALGIYSQYNSGEIGKIAERLGKYKNIQSVDVLPYRNFSGSKYEALGEKNTMPNVPMPEKKEIENAKNILRSAGLTVND